MGAFASCKPDVSGKHPGGDSVGLNLTGSKPIQRGQAPLLKRCKLRQGPDVFSKVVNRLLRSSLSLNEADNSSGQAAFGKVSATCKRDDRCCDQEP